MLIILLSLRQLKCAESCSDCTLINDHCALKKYSDIFFCNINNAVLLTTFEVWYCLILQTCEICRVFTLVNSFFSIVFKWIIWLNLLICYKEDLWFNVSFLRLFLNCCIDIMYRSFSFYGICLFIHCYVENKSYWENIQKVHIFVLFTF